jgi:hypothetical protein
MVGRQFDDANKPSFDEDNETSKQARKKESNPFVTQAIRVKRRHRKKEATQARNFRLLR